MCFTWREASDMFAVQSVVQFMAMGQRMRGESKERERERERGRVVSAASQFYSLVCPCLSLLLLLLVVRIAYTPRLPPDIFLLHAFYANEAKYCSMSNILCACHTHTQTPSHTQG